MDSFRHDDSDEEVDQETLMSRMMRAVAVHNTIVNDSLLLERFRMYEAVSNWSSDDRLNNLFEESKALLDPDLLTQIGIIETPALRATFISDAPNCIFGHIKEPDLRFVVPFFYSSGAYKTSVDKAVIEVHRENDHWSPRPMTTEEYGVVQPTVERLLENATLLLHESCKRQISEFNKYFEHVRMPGYSELARATTECRLWSQSTYRDLKDSQGKPFRANWSIAGTDDQRSSIVNGTLVYSDGKSTEFGVAEIVFVGDSLAHGLKIGVSDEEFVTTLPTLEKFFPPRIEDWNHARAIVDRGLVCQILSNLQHPVHLLRQSLIEEERVMAPIAECILRYRGDLDGLTVRPHFGR